MKVPSRFQDESQPGKRWPRLTQAMSLRQPPPLSAIGVFHPRILCLQGSPGFDSSRPQPESASVTKQLQDVVRQAHHLPFRLRILQTTDTEPAKAPAFLDLSEIYSRQAHSFTSTHLRLRVRQPRASRRVCRPATGSVVTDPRGPRRHTDSVPCARLSLSSGVAHRKSIHFCHCLMTYGRREPDRQIEKTLATRSRRLRPVPRRRRARSPAAPTEGPSGSPPGSAGAGCCSPPA